MLEKIKKILFKSLDARAVVCFAQIMLATREYHHHHHLSILSVYGMVFLCLLFSFKENNGQQKNPLFRLFEVLYFVLILLVQQHILSPFVASLLIFMGILAQLFRCAVFEQNETYHTFFGSSYLSFSTYFSIIIGALIAAVLPIPVVLGIIIAILTYKLVISVMNAEDFETYSFHFFGIKKAIEAHKTLKKHPLIYRSALGVAWIWSMSFLILCNVDDVEQGNFGILALLFVLATTSFAGGFSVGLRQSRRVIDLTFIPLNTALMTFSLLMMTILSALRIGEVFFCLFWVINAFNAGMYVVPMVLQLRKKINDSTLEAAYITNKFQDFFCFAIAFAITVLRYYLKLSTPWLFGVCTLIGLFVLIYGCRLSPKDLQRSIIRTLFELLFHVTVKNQKYCTQAGRRVLIIANHTSTIDALLIAAFMPERISVILPIESKNTLLEFFCRIFADVHIVDIKDAMALRPIITLLKQNNKVLVFPERRSSVTGGLMKIYPGVGIIAQRANANILPICISGAQYSKFSLQKSLHKTYWLPKIRLTIFEPKKLEADPALDKRKMNYAIALQLYRIMNNMIIEGCNNNQNIFNVLLSSAETFGQRKEIAEDASRKTLTYRQLILKSYVLGNTIKNIIPNDEYVGVMMPNVLANVVLVFGLIGHDKVPTMLNFSSGIAQVLSCVRTLQLKTIITSHAFIAGAKLEELEKALLKAEINLLYLEDVAKNMTPSDKIKGIVRFICKNKPKRTSDQAAVVLFTSGSEGMPKAVLLSHTNLLVNGNQGIAEAILNPADVFFNALPMFHSFGLGMGTFMTTLHGLKTIYYPSPLHYRIIPELVYDTNTTVLVGTDTFLAGYGEVANPYDFYKLRMAVVGAEKLKESTANLYLKKFGIRIMEGYGSTECSPLISVNSGLYYKEGSVGRIVPTLDYKLEPVEGITDGKRLFLRGKNVMMGYIKAENPGVLEPVENGWYDTGDIVDIDEEDFIFIKGRAKRFAKVGGEMVSLTAVEIAINELYPNTMNAVVAISDPKKGERLVLFTTETNVDLSKIKAFIKQKGLSDLSSPAVFHELTELPLIGSGKVDYVSLKKTAEISEK